MGIIKKWMFLAISCLFLASFMINYALLAADEGGEAKTKLNINTATLEELIALPKVGKRDAKKIIEYRVKNGGFKSIEEIKDVRGIGPRTFDEIKDLIAVGGEDKSTEKSE